MLAASRTLPLRARPVDADRRPDHPWMSTRSRMPPASRCRRQPRPAGVDHPSRRAAEERGLLNLSGGGTQGGGKRSVALEVGMYERQEASGVESAHLSCHRLRITVLVGCALLRGGVGAPPAGGGCEPDHHGDHPAQRRALLDTSERSPAVPAKRRRVDRFGGAGARRPQWLRKSWFQHTSHQVRGVLK